MRLFITLTAVLATYLATPPVTAAPDGTKPPGSSDFILPEVGRSAAPSAFGDAQVAFVLAWIQEKAPGCPTEAAANAAEKFLGELQLHHPAALDRLLRPDFPAREHESALLREVGAQLSTPAQAALRATVAQHRVEALLAATSATQTGPTAAEAALARIKEKSPAQYRRLLEGKTDDEQLAQLCKPPRETGVDRKETAAAKPKVLDAAEIVAEFGRRHQTPGALARLRAYAMEIRVQSLAGEEQVLSLQKLRPDRFRLLLRSHGQAQVVVANDGRNFWRQLPGQAPAPIAAQALGTMRYLGDFIDPLFEPEGCGLERKEDAILDGRKCYRIAVRRGDGSAYMVALDQENFHMLGRENSDGSRVRYSDVRDEAGLFLAHREDITSAEGKHGSMELIRFSANPGLVEAFFTPPVTGELDFFAIDRLLTGPEPANLPAVGKTER